MRLRLAAPPLSLVAALAGLAACSSPSAAPPLRHLERPGDMAFGCVGVFPASTGSFTGALPPLACPFRGQVPVPAGQDAGVPDGGAIEYTPLGFVLEPVRGALSVARLPNGGFVDSDRFSPGLNGVSVGRQPVAVTASTEGCYAVTANAGSCDLAKVDVVKAVGSRSDAVSFVPITSLGRRILARPTNVVARAGLPTATISDCQAPSEVYVTFESCHLVARVDLASGAIIDGILSPPGEAPRVVGADVTCPVECSAAEIEETARPQEVDAGAEEPADAGPVDARTADARPAADAAPLPALGTQPTALAIELDSVRLYAGGPESSGLVIADLDSAGKVTALSAVTLEGGVGIKKISPSGPIIMGNGNTSLERRYAYIVATDSSVRVVDVTPGRTPTECDTQIDRRYLHDEFDIELMSCFPVGRKENPPRRADADGPGIRLPRGVLPLDVAFIRPGNALAVPERSTLNGVFAYITAVGPVADSRLGRGVVYVVNVDDDNYPDTEEANFQVDIALALPHSLRDNTPNRNLSGTTGCIENAQSGAAPVRVDPDVTRPNGFLYSDTGVEGDPLAPGLRRTLCSNTDLRFAPYELQASAQPALRAQLIGDLEKIAPRSVASGTSSNDSIVVVWEGPLDFDTIQSRRRGGKLTARSSTVLDLAAPGGLLCSLGGEAGDVVQLLGCDSDADCAVDEVCVIHPDTPSGLNGMCAPRDRQIEYVSQCRSLLVSSRRFTALELYQDRAVITPRPEVLAASPIEGCDDSVQCGDIEKAVLTRIEGAQGLPANTFPRHEFTCERDIAMGGPRRCILACQDDSACNAGSVCIAGRCMQAPVPTPECISGLQRYELRGGDSFMVLSSLGTFNHRQMVEPGTGRCVENTALNPLIQNRIRRIEPPCQDLSIESQDPNPCQITDLTEPVEADDGFSKTRPSYGMRIRSPGISIDISDVAARLNGFPSDVLVSNIPHDFGFRIEVLGGFTPFTFALAAALPERIRTGPDGLIWVVDSGDASGGLTRGQVFRMNSQGLDTEANRLR